MKNTLKGSAALLLLICNQALYNKALAEDEAASHERGVKVVAEQRLSVGNKGVLPLYVSNDWSKTQPSITRAVVVLHGRLRNADVYYRSALTAQAAAGNAGKSTIMIVPQFLAEVDIERWHLPPDALRWSLEGWEGGEPALGPTPASSFDALDAILARLADRNIFPNLKQVVVAGHSGGGQVVQRYAIATQGEGRSPPRISACATWSPIRPPTPISARSGRSRRSRRPARATIIGNTAWRRARPTSQLRHRRSWSSAMSHAR
jgi:pimeloyl-ACP methyl ester carboxylesterase